MTRRSWSPVWVLAVLCSAACGRSPTEPSGAPSFLAGTWQGTVTIEVNPGEAGGLPATTAATTWTFEVVPQTNHADVSGDGPVGTSVAADHHGRLDRARPDEYTAHAYQHPRRLQLSTWLPRHVRQLRNGGGDANRRGLYRRGL